LDTPTRWSSTCDFLEKAIKLKKPLNHFLFEDDDLKEYKLDDASWALLEKTYEFLKVIVLLTDSYSDLQQKQCLNRVCLL
jgi:hypothetical protein